MSTEVAPEIGAEKSADKGFHVTLSNFEGPFDLLLSLIARHRIEVTQLGRKASRSRSKAATSSAPAPVAADTAKGDTDGA